MKKNRVKELPPSERPDHPPVIYPSRSLSIKRHKQTGRVERLLGITEQGKKVWALNDQGIPICGGYDRIKNWDNDGRIEIVPNSKCESTILHYNGRCDKHGGKTPKTLASIGSRSKYLTHLNAQYALDFIKFVNNPDILSLREDIGLVDLRLMLLAREMGGLPADNIDALRDFLDDVRYTLTKLPVDEDLLEPIEALLMAGYRLVNQRRTWEEIKDTQEHRRRLTETEMKRVESGMRQISTEKVFAIITGILLSVRARIDDPHIMRAIRSDVGKLIVLPQDIPPQIYQGDKPMLQPGDPDNENYSRVRYGDITEESESE